MRTISQNDRILLTLCALANGQGNCDCFKRYIKTGNKQFCDSIEIYAEKIKKLIGEIEKENEI